MKTKKQIIKQVTIPNDTTSALVVMTAIKKDSAPLIKKVSSLEVKTQDDYDTAFNLLKALGAMKDAAEAKEKNLTEPLNKLLKDVRALFKPFRDEVGAITTDTKAKMLKFIEGNKNKVEKIEARLESGTISVATAVRKAAELQTSGNRKVWEAVEVDGAKTPRKYMVPDVALIKEALKAGQKVPGWEWRQVDKITI